MLQAAGVRIAAKNGSVLDAHRSSEPYRDPFPVTSPAAGRAHPWRGVAPPPFALAETPRFTCISVSPAASVRTPKETLMNLASILTYGHEMLLGAVDGLSDAE